MKKNLLSIISFILFLFPSFHSQAQAGQWTWIKGVNGNANNAVYGQQGIPANSNTPQGLYEACEWTDKQGDFWIFGGWNNNFYSNLWRYNISSNQWTWMKGPGNFAGEPPIYGTLGVPAVINTPGGRGRGIATWVDTAGGLWLFGGSNSNGDALGDLWKYDVGINEWAWMGGTNNVNASGVYGTQGVPDSLNHPGGRLETSATWTDANNDLWLFGGYGLDISGIDGLMNDIWKYNISTNEWTWIRGSESNSNTGTYGSKGVADSANNPPCRMIFTKWKSADEKFWIFGGGDFLSGNYYNDGWRFDPSTNLWTWMSGPNSPNGSANAGALCSSDTSYIGTARFENRACWVTGCGDFWTFGGAKNSDLGVDYSDLWHFNSQTLEWTLVKGTVNNNGSYSYGTQGVSSATNLPPSRGGSLPFEDSLGNLWMFGGYASANLYNDVWRFVIDSSCSNITACTNFPVANFAAALTTFCDSTCISFTEQALNNPTSWQWYFPGAVPDSSTDANPANICYYTAGSFDVTLIVTNANGSDTLVSTGYITVNTSPPPPVITLSNDTLYSSTANTYQWYINGVLINGATNGFYVPPSVGLYTVEITSGSSCTASSDFYFSLIGFASNDTAVCEKFCISFTDQSMNSPTAWLWIFAGGVPSTSTAQNPTNICYNAPGVYDVTLITTNAFGNDTLIQHDYVTVYATPPFPTITQVGYTLTSSAADSYQWQFNSVNIPGATNPSYTVLQTGYYTVIVSDSNGCVNSTTQYVLISGIADQVSDQNIFIEPNPSDGNFLLMMNNLQQEKFQIQIFNAIGQNIFSEDAIVSSSSFSKEIHINASAGIYLVTISAGEKIWLKKIVIDKQ